MKAVIPLAGKGTRLYPLGVTTPKALTPILNKPLLQWSLETLAANNVNEVILIVGDDEFAQQIRTYTQENSIPGVKIQFAIQKKQHGTAHALQAAKDLVSSGEEFLFIYGDDLYGPETIAQIVQHDGLAVTGKKVDDPKKWGVFQHDENNKLLKVVEKPSEFIGDLANIGCMKLNSRAFELFDQLQLSERGEYELTDTLQLLAQETNVQVFSTKDYWIPLGYPWHILDATAHLAKNIEPKIEGEVEKGVTIKGTLVLPKSSKIKAGSYIEGAVIIGENVVIGPNAHVRGTTVINDGSSAGFGVQIKNSVLGKNCALSHLSYFGDSILGNNINVPVHSAAGNLRHDGNTIKTQIKGKLVDTGRHKFGTVIGDNVKLGMGTTIYPGRKIWPNKTTYPGEIVAKDIID